MRRAQGNVGVRLLECINPVKNKWRIRWDVQESGNENGNVTVTYMENDFDHKPTIEEVKSMVNGYYNTCIENEIVSGFKWNGMSVWLSGENQFNYKASYDLAVQTDKSLPVTFKFGTDEEPIYHTFTTLEELTDFYTKAMNHVQRTLVEGWQKKDSIDYELYK